MQICYARARSNNQNTKKSTGVQQKKGSPVLYDIINETLSPTPLMTVRRSGRNRRVPRRFVQDRARVPFTSEALWKSLDE